MALAITSAGPIWQSTGAQITFLPGTSSSTPGSNKRICTFEELLLETVKQAPSEPKKAKKKIGKGAEVITCIEHSNQTISTTESLTENGNSESELSDPVYEDDDDDIEAEMREQKDLEKCVEEISKPIEDITMLKYYVGLVVSTEDKLVEVKFSKRIPSLNPHASTFTWADEENSFLPRCDIVSTLPKPSLSGRRNFIKFDIDFSACNVQ
ncbi:hypothetical protein FQA39_LY03819 [Lamprigera yunnana]|nr:hypothetical protein FQA39_LY03819 [Lamprigera yunnana]